MKQARCKKTDHANLKAEQHRDIREWWGLQQIGERTFVLKWAHVGLSQESPRGNSGLGLWVVLSEKLEIHLFM